MSNRKTCKKCGRSKKITSYHFINKERGWRTSYCKECERTRLRLYMRENWRKWAK